KTRSAAAKKPSRRAAFPSCLVCLTTFACAGTPTDAPREEVRPALGDEAALAGCPASGCAWTDVREVFFRLDQSGSLGTIEHTIAMYNKYVVDAGKAKTSRHITDKSEIVDPSGRPIDWALRAHVIYPAAATGDVPLVFAVAVDPGSTPGTWGLYRS